MDVEEEVEVFKFFRRQNKYVVTFVGYSGAGYEDEKAMLDKAGEILEDLDTSKTIVNIGATPEGIGQVYELAKLKNFETTGIVSTRAKTYPVSSFVDHVFFIKDETWGGFLNDGDQLSPTSKAMVHCSDEMVGIGGGAVARDELIAAQQAKKKVRFFPADRNHEKARAKDITDFSGEASTCRSHISHIFPK